MTRTAYVLNGKRAVAALGATKQNYRMFVDAVVNAFEPGDEIENVRDGRTRSIEGRVEYETGLLDTEMTQINLGIVRKTNE